MSVRDWVEYHCNTHGIPAKAKDAVLSAIDVAMERGEEGWSHSIDTPPKPQFFRDVLELYIKMTARSMR